MPTWPFLLGLVLLSAGCGSPTEPDPARLAQEFTLAPGGSARVADVDLTVSFDRVVSDSRCPVDVTCIWEGDAVVVVTLSQPSRAQARLELHSSGRFARTARYGDLEIALVGLAPEPKAGSEIAQSAYRATFLVTR